MAKKKAIKRDFIDFIIEAQKDPMLTAEFLGQKGLKKADLKAWFDRKEFEGVTGPQCEKLLKAMKNIDPVLGKYPPLVYLKG
jgi:hypothetical protein